MKRYVIKICIALLVVPSVGWTQTDSDHPLTDLFVRRIQVRFTLCGSLIGMGSTASLVGESVVWRESDASSLSWNPAALGFLKRRSLFADWVPGIVQDVSKFYDVDGEIKSAMDDAVDEYGTDQSEVVYPTVTPNVGFQSSVAGFGLAIPFRTAGRRFGVGFGYSTPLLMDIQLTGTGIEAGIDSEQDIQGEMKRVRMRTRANLNGSFRIRVHQFVFGGGCELWSGFGLGFSVSRFRMRISGRAFAGIDGIIEMSGSEYAFNDPYDPRIDFDAGERNDLNQSFLADYTGSGWGFKFGVVQRLSEGFQLGVCISLPPKIEISGVDSTVSNKIPFIKLENGDDNGGGLEDLIDPTEIDLAKLTLTERIVKKNEFSPQLQLPRAYNFGIIWGSGIFSLTLRYTLYDGSFSVGLLNDEIHGLKFKYGVGLGLDFTYFFFGASANFIEEIVPAGEEGIIPEEYKNYPLPKVNLGFRIPTFSGLWIDGLLGIEPTPLLRFTVRYSF